MDLTKIRIDTSIFENYSYLDTAAAAPPPQIVIDVMKEYLDKTASVGPYLPSFRREVYQEIDRVRDKAARFIGADAKELAFVKNGTEGINFIANGLVWNVGDEIILADCEFHSNYVPWLRLQKKENIHVKVIKTDSSGVIDIEQLKSMMTSRTRLITVSHLPNASGALQPVEEICKVARKHGVLTLVNASQTLGVVPIDVKKMDCDFLAACGRKALRGPEGSGLLYIRESLIGCIEPTIVGWGGTNWVFETNEYEFLPIARRVEAGCPIVPSILGFGAAIEYAESIGIEAIHARVSMLTEYAVHELKTISPLTIYGPEQVENRLAILPFNVEGLDSDRITEYLEEHQVIIESGTFMANTMLQQYGIGKMARLSLHYFNTTDEINQVVKLIKKLL